jgi:hypothetical protein
MSINARVVLLVKDDTTLHKNGYECINEKMDYHILSKI